MLKTTTDFTSRVSKSYAPFSCKFPMVLILYWFLNKCYWSKNNFYVFSNDKTSLKFCESFRCFLAMAVLMKKF